MYSLRDNIFSLFYSDYDKKVDSNKDADGKGTFERYNEVVGDDLDSNIIPLIDNLIPNLIMPATCFDRYVPFLESETGYNDVNISLRLSNDIIYRRAVLKILNKISNIRGTLKCYRVLFGKIGITVAYTEYDDEYGFDSPLTLDDPVRRFDSACPSCSDYSLVLTGPTISNAIIAAIQSIITFNQPINARLRSITYNGGALTELTGDFNTDYNTDYYV